MPEAENQEFPADVRMNACQTEGETTKQMDTDTKVSAMATAKAMIAKHLPTVMATVVRSKKRNHRHQTSNPCSCLSCSLSSYVVSYHHSKPQSMHRYPWQNSRVLLSVDQGGTGRSFLRKSSLLENQHRSGLVKWGQGITLSK